MRASLTHHAKDRSRQRLGLSLAAAERLAEIALEKGITHAETAGALHRYLDAQAMTHGGAQYRLYAESVFIFQGSRLITVFALPNRFKATLRKIRAAKRGGIAE